MSVVNIIVSVDAFREKKPRSVLFEKEENSGSPDLVSFVFIIKAEAQESEETQTVNLKIVPDDAVDQHLIEYIRNTLQYFKSMGKPLKIDFPLLTPEEIDEEQTIKFKRLLASGEPQFFSRVNLENLVDGKYKLIAIEIEDVKTFNGSKENPLNMKNCVMELKKGRIRSQTVKVEFEFNNSNFKLENRRTVFKGGNGNRNKDKISVIIKNQNSRFIFKTEIQSDFVLPSESE